MLCFLPFFSRRGARRSANGNTPVRWHTLSVGALLPMRGCHRLRVVCVRGAVWLTSADDARDVILHANDTITRVGRQHVLQALADSVVEISIDTPAEIAAMPPEDQHHV